MLTKAKIKLYSDQIIEGCLSSTFSKSNRFISVFNLFKPYINFEVYFVQSEVQKQTNKHIIQNISLGHITFRINKDLAKKIGLYPYNKRKYKVVYKLFFLKSDFKSKYSDRFSGFHENQAVKKTIHFSSISHKDVKKFELPKLLMWLSKLNKDIFLKVEKVLFEFTG